MTDDKSRSAGMTPPFAQRETARKNAQNHFAASEKRDSEVRQEILRQQAATAAKTAKLRALRLQKEEADRLAAAALPPRKSSSKAASRAKAR
jgi:hypothetical protein